MKVFEWLVIVAFIFVTSLVFSLLSASYTLVTNETIINITNISYNSNLTGTGLKDYIPVWLNNTHLNFSVLKMESNGLHTNASLWLPDTETLFFDSSIDGFINLTGDYIKLYANRGVIASSWYLEPTLITGFSASSRKPLIMNEVSSTSNPVFTFYGDDNTGLSSSSSDVLSLTAGGLEMARFVESSVDYAIITKDLSVGTVAAPKRSIDTEGAIQYGEDYAEEFGFLTGSVGTGLTVNISITTNQGGLIHVYGTSINDFALGQFNYATGSLSYADIYDPGNMLSAPGNYIQITNPSIITPSTFSVIFEGRNVGGITKPK